MIDDFCDNNTLGGTFELKRHVDTILQHKSSRAYAEQWVKNLRFLTYDDSEMVERANSTELRDHADSQLIEQCLPCEHKLPLAPLPHQGQTIPRTAKSRASMQRRNREAQKYDNACVHVQKVSCSDCRHIPLFPNQGLVKKFRIRRLRPIDVRPQDLPVCCHFVAISYCWSSSEYSEDKLDGSYSVIEEDGQKRSARAPRSVLNRAVEFARHNGVRMIWIDQECIQQDITSESIKTEKEKAIQAMDLVYSRAHFSIGLLNSVFEEQDHIDALWCIHAEIDPHDFTPRRPRRSSKRNLMSGGKLAEVIENIVMDRWNTRAWVVQEAFASSGRMILLFPRTKEIDVTGWSLARHDLSDTEIAIELYQLGELLKKAVQTIDRRLSKARIEVKNWSAVREGVQWFHPKVKTSFTTWIWDDKPRPSCNAAVALSFLKGRGLYRAADRLAILANMCDYELRIDTDAIDKTDIPLSACFLALALINGDHSLTVPEVSRLTAYSLRARVDDDLRTEFTWAPHNTKSLSTCFLSSSNPRGMSFGENNPSLYSLSKEGFQTQGSLWRIDEFVDLGSIQHKYEEAWDRVKKMATTSSDFKGKLMVATTHILYSTLLELRSRDQIELANAIWQSVSGMFASERAYSHNIPDMPDSILGLSEKWKLENRKNLFDLDVDEHGAPRHLWLINRIMQQGGLWVGRRIVRSSDEDCHKVSARVRKNKRPNSPQERHYNKLVTMALLTKMVSYVSRRDLSESNPENLIHTNALALAQFANECRSFSENRARQKMGDAVAESIFSTSTPDREAVFDDCFSKDEWVYMNADGNRFDANDNKTDANRNLIDANGELLSENPITREAYDSHLRPFYDDDFQYDRAVFDVEGNSDGSVLILTPFVIRMEGIPRPEIRAMSVSWLVKAMPYNLEDNKNDPADCDNVTERFRTLDMVQGMWKYQLRIPMTAYRLL